MAKLATQRIVFQLSKAVPNTEAETLDVLTGEALEQLQEAIVALAGDDSIIVEAIEG